MALMAAHALMFAAELVRYETEVEWAERLWVGFADTFVPGWYDSGTGRIAIPLGQGALYLAIPLGLLFYVRHRIGANTWRRLHRFVIVVYVLSVWHTLLYGTNVWYGEWPRTVLWLLHCCCSACCDRPGGPSGWAPRAGAVARPGPGGGCGGQAGSPPRPSSSGSSSWRCRAVTADGTARPTRPRPPRTNRRRTDGQNRAGGTESWDGMMAGDKATAERGSRCESGAVPPL
jgi:hypothetical protein